MSNWWTRRADEQKLQLAIMLAEHDPTSTITRKAWDAVQACPRWQVAQVTISNAPDRLRESQSGITYTPAGRRHFFGSARRNVVRHLRQARREGDTDSIDTWTDILNEGLNPPSDWQTTPH